MDGSRNIHGMRLLYSEIMWHGTESDLYRPDIISAYYANKVVGT